MLNTELKINKAFKEQVESNLTKTFGSTTMEPIRIVLRKYNTHILSIMIFIETERT